MDYIGKAVKINRVELRDSMASVIGKIGIVIAEEVYKTDQAKRDGRFFRVMTLDGQTWWFSADEIDIVSGNPQTLFDIRTKEAATHTMYYIDTVDGVLTAGQHISLDWASDEKRILSRTIYGIHADGAVLMAVNSGHNGNLMHAGACNTIVRRDVFKPMSDSNNLWWIRPELISKGIHINDEVAMAPIKKESRFQDKIGKTFVDLISGTEYNLVSIDTTTNVFKYDFTNSVSGEVHSVSANEPRYPDGIIADVLVEKSRMGYHSLDEDKFVGIHELERAIATMSKGGTQ